MVLMAKKHAPALPVGRVVYEESDGSRIEAPYKVIRLWEIDPSMALNRAARRFCDGCRCKVLRHLFAASLEESMGEFRLGQLAK
jgi:hypothetical protein